MKWDGPGPVRGDREFLDPGNWPIGPVCMKYTPLPDVCAIAPDEAQRPVGPAMSGRARQRGTRGVCARGRGNVDQGQASILDLV